MKKDALFQIGNIPFTSSVLSTLFSNTKQINDKARYLEQEGRIIRLKRGLYVRSADDGALPVPFLIANHLYVCPSINCRNDCLISLTLSCIC